MCDLFGVPKNEYEKKTPSEMLDYYLKRYSKLGQLLDSFDPYVFQLLNPILPFSVSKVPITAKPSLEYVADATMNAILQIISAIGKQKKVIKKKNQKSR